MYIYTSFHEADASGKMELKLDFEDVSATCDDEIQFGRCFICIRTSIEIPLSKM